jgi:hypothetical protein
MIFISKFAIRNNLLTPRAKFAIRNPCPLRPARHCEASAEADGRNSKLPPYALCLNPASFP